MKAKVLCGTPEYAAPEIVKREAYGLKADMWSLGYVLCSFFECEHIKTYSTFRITAYKLLRGKIPEGAEILGMMNDPARIEQVAKSIEDKVSYEFQGNKSLSFLSAGNSFLLL